jgi:hypothetical protein
MVCVGLFTTIRTAALRGCAVVDAALACGIAGFELLGVLGDSDLVSVLGVGVLPGDVDWVSEVPVLRGLERGRPWLLPL